MTRNSNDLPLVKLIGDPLENFYQLGLKDRDRHNVVLSHINNLIKTPWKPVDLVAGEVLKQVLSRTLANCPHFKKNLGAYAEGLERPFDEVARGLLTPELLSFMSRWIPGVPPGLLGCSSYFFWDEDTNSPAHGRVLDFPLLGSYDKEERLLFTKFTDQPKIFSYGAAGMPYPGLTAMNSHGVSFALHQKFSDSLYSKGTPIFELAYQFMSEVGDSKSALEFLKSNKTLTAWAFNVGFSNGEVLMADLVGEELHYRLDQLEPGKIIYVNNKLENKERNQEDYFPYGFSEFNDLREEVALEKIKTFNGKKITSKKVLEVISTPLINNKMPLRPDPATMSSLGISVFNPSQAEALINPGPAPKYFTSKAHQINKIWDGPEAQLIDISKKRTDDNYHEGMRHLMLAQVAFDKLIKQDIYHHLQMSVDLLEGYKEKDLAYFYFLVFQYMEEKHDKVRSSLLDKFKSLDGKLTPYLEENRKLFIYRLERLTKIGVTIQERDFTSEKIKTLFKEEEKLPNFLLHQATTLLLNPRIDMWDIIHAHIKA